MGEVSNDCVVCPYHGWQYNMDGVCVHIPANQTNIAIPKKARVDNYPVEEKYGFIWVFMGDLLEGRPPVPPLPEYGQPGWRGIYGQFQWQAHYTRVMENLFDIAHFPIVHGSSVGKPLDPEINNYKVKKQEWSASTSLYLKRKKSNSFLFGKRSPALYTFSFFMPCVAEVRLDFGSKMIIYAVNTPIDEKTTLTRWLVLRNFARWSLLDFMFRKRVLTLLTEDRPVTESVRPELLPYNLAEELHIPSDAITTSYRQMRKVYFDKGWGIDSHFLNTLKGQKAVVIPSPARSETPELENAWVFKEMPLQKVN
jgi:phenylpropionate dioxygenase-like ring-hydroxylating dioxygenase large terminal subunit